MKSLRSRLIFGTAFVAVVPMAIAIAILSNRVGAMVHRDASARLDGSLQAIVAGLHRNRETLDAKLTLLARDPTLRRLYLVQGNDRERAQFLDERRVLLGLDFLSTESAEAADSATILASSVPIVYDGRAVGQLRGGYVLDERYLDRLKASSGVDLILRDRSGDVAASTRLGADARGLSSTAPLELTTPQGTQLTAFVSTADADRAIRGFQIVAILLGLLGLALAVALATAWSAQISRPVERIAAFSRRVARGEWSEPLELRSVRELETLATALDTMRADLATYRERLVTTERQAAWSLMARKVAHEVKNPLTPIAVSVSDLKRSYDQNRADFPAVLDQAVRTISEEVAALKRILNEFSEFARLPAPAFRACSDEEILEGLATLYAGDQAQGRLMIAKPGVATTFRADADQLRQALINLVQNGLDASNGSGPVTVRNEARDGGMAFVVADAGPGLSDEQRANLFVPGFTTKATGSGLGLTIAQRIAHDHGGTLTADAAPNRGTRMTLWVPLRND